MFRGELLNIQFLFACVTLIKMYFKNKEVIGAHPRRWSRAIAPEIQQE